MTCQEKTIHLEVCGGYVSAKEPYLLREGTITIEGVDLNISSALLLSPWEMQRVRRKKDVVSGFIEEYKECFFEVMDEMSGFDQAEWTGRPNVPGERGSREMSLFIVFTEIIVYETAV